MISALIELLASFYQQGDIDGVAMMAQTILRIIPDDLVALQFLALAFLQLGAKDRALSLFRKAAALHDSLPAAADSACEPARLVSYREATRSDSGLADGWQRISVALERNGMSRLAERARQAAQVPVSAD